jgi:uncharacterized NAD(P)/FAD-binding protein YdhS
LAVHILRQAKTPVSLLLIEKRGAFGRGVAYSTGNPSHVLNVRVANMSAFPDDPFHFLKWLWRRDDLAAPSNSIPPSGHAFVPRALYGRYLEEQLDEAIVKAAPGIVCERVAAEIVDLRAEAGGFELMLARGKRRSAGQVALCLGHFPPRLPLDESTSDLPLEKVIDNPWHAEALGRVPAEASVLVLGTGLTMVDVVLSLLDQKHSGPIIALSRRGLLPTPHAQGRTYRDFLAERPLPRRVLDTLMLIRQEIRAAAEKRYDWRSVIDALRPHIQAIWQGLDSDERRRFLRHARPYWEVHRHRVAPAAAKRLHAAIGAGKLSILAGRIRSMASRDDGLLTEYAPRRGVAIRELRSDVMINCAGPECDFTRIADPLVRSLLDQGLIRSDPLGLGVETTPYGEAIGRDGRPVPGLLALGPIARGAFWELTAVPELRSLCAVTGRRLAHSLGQDAEPLVVHHSPASMTE